MSLWSFHKLMNWYRFCNNRCSLYIHIRNIGIVSNNCISNTIIINWLRIENTVARYLVIISLLIITWCRVKHSHQTLKLFFFLRIKFTLFLGKICDWCNSRNNWRLSIVESSWSNQLSISSLRFNISSAIICPSIHIKGPYLINVLIHLLVYLFQIHFIIVININGSCLILLDLVLWSSTEAEPTAAHSTTAKTRAT